MLESYGNYHSQIAKAESALRELEIKLEHLQSIVAERKAQRLELETQVKTIRSTGDINELMQLQSRSFALDKAVADLVASEAECRQRIEAARRNLYTLYVHLEKLRQEASTLAKKSLLLGDERSLPPEEQNNLRRLRLQIQALTGAE
jgi:hypothetical protein